MSTTTVPTTDAACESRAALVAGLRDLAGFLEAHPEIPDPHVWAIRWSHFGEGAEAFRAACDAMRERGFAVGKGTSEKDITVSCEFAGGITLAVEARRDQIAEQRTETREVTEYVLPEWAQTTTPAEGTA